jgi:2'-5' RNA ligase
MANLRLFFGVPLPDEVQNWIDAALADLSFPSARWVPNENRHVTLRFLGSVSEDRLEEVLGAGRDAAGKVAPATLAPSGLGIFPSLRRARVLWVGVDDPDRALQRAEGSLTRFLDLLGWAPEGREFTPHITVARFKAPLAVGDLPAPPSHPPAFSFGSFNLYRSHTGPRGSRYEVVGSFPLAFRP